MFLQSTRLGYICQEQERNVTQFRPLLRRTTNINGEKRQQRARQNRARCCLLYKNDPEKGPICNPAKYMSPDGKEVSYFKKEG